MNISAISLSGMNAAQTRLQATAHNVANMNAAATTRQEVSQNTAPSGGVSTSLKSIASAGGNNLASDMVELLQAKHAYLANLTVFKANNEALGSLINTSA